MNMRQRSIPPVAAISGMLFDEAQCISFLLETGVLTNRTVCIHCNGPVSRYALRFQCTRASCKKSVSTFAGSFFAGIHIKCCEVMHLAYLWLSGCSADTMQTHTGHSSATVSAYRTYLRQLVSEMVDTDDVLIGGPGITVQVDETKMGKRKYHRGHRVEGAWVIVGVELTEERRVFAEVVQDRSERTIVELLGRHIAQGSELWTDCWKGYGSVSRIYGITHRTVNHSMWFKDPETSVNTNTVEGTNYAIKRSVPPRNRTASSLPSHLLEFVWRRKHHNTLWDGLVDGLKAVTYVSNQ